MIFVLEGLESRMSTRCPICASNAARSTAATSTAACPLADEWANDERMAFLTSRITPGDVNARDQMVRFWSKATQHAFEEASSLSLDLGLLKRSSLAWGGATAPGVELGMADMLASGDLLRRSNLEVFVCTCGITYVASIFPGVGQSLLQILADTASVYSSAAVRVDRYGSVVRRSQYLYTAAGVVDTVVVKDAPVSREYSHVQTLIIGVRNA